MEERYQKAVELYREWNEKINVISRKDMDNVYEHHILHSLAIAEYMRRFYPQDALEWENGSGERQQILDVGTGGGFPGIPLAMEFGGADFTLCDSIGKKIKVATAVAEGLGLGNVQCVNARAESLGKTFDWVVSRAVTSLDNFYPWVKGCYRRSILYLKGGDVNAEISELVRKCGVKPAQVRAWRIDEWLKDNYFAEKFVIEIGKDYLCRP